MRNLPSSSFSRETTLSAPRSVLPFAFLVDGDGSGLNPRWLVQPELQDVASERGPFLPMWRGGLAEVRHHFSLLLSLCRRARRRQPRESHFACLRRCPSLGALDRQRANTVERRFRDPKDSTRYRNRLQLERSIDLASASFRAFVSDEVFYDWSASAWARNRFLIGARKPLNNRVSLDLFYVRQNDRHTVPRDLHAFGIALNTRF